MTIKDVKVGANIKFKGYGPDVAESDQLLTADTEYTVLEVDQKEKKITVEIENPSFNKKLKPSEKNPATLLVDVFEEEFELPAPPAAAKAPARAAAKPAAVAAKPGVRPTGTRPPAAAAKPATKAVAKAKAPEPEPEEEAPEVEALESEDAEIAALVNESTDLIALAREVASESAATDYKLGGILYHVHLDGAYKELDARYAENGGYGLFVKESLNIEYRKAMYLEKIYFQFNKCGIDGAKVAEIGWTKAAKIAEIMEDQPEEATALLKLAEENSVADLVENIKASYKTVGGTPGEKKKVIVFRFRTFEDSAEVVRAALEGCAAAMGFTGSKALDQAFEHIVTEWATEHPVAAPAKAPAGARRVAAPAKAAAKPAARAVAKPAARAAAK